MRHLLLALAFLTGYVVHDLTQNLNIGAIHEAKAEVAGMDHYDLKRDLDFKRAVQSIVDDAISSSINAYDYNFSSAVKSVVDDSISAYDYNFSSAVKSVLGNCYIADDFIYC